MSKSKDKDETVVEFTKAELNEYLQRRVREIVWEKYRIKGRRKLSSLAGNPQILNSLRDKEGNFPTKEELRKMFELERTHEILSRIMKKDGGYHKPTKEELLKLLDPEKSKELAAHVVELHMDTRRSEAVPRAFKNYLRRSDSLIGPILIEEMDRAMTDYKAESAE